MRKNYLRSLANSSAGSTSEIMRNILGERVLSLPGEPRTDRDLLEGHATLMSDSTGIDPQLYRTVLGNYPTGVVVITAIDSAGAPAGMAVGSFTSVSLDPPLVAFLPDKSSTSFPKIRTASSFCVNVLAAEQEDVCRAFARTGGDKFARIA